MNNIYKLAVNSMLKKISRKSLEKLGTKIYKFKEKRSLNLNTNTILNINQMKSKNPLKITGWLYSIAISSLCWGIMGTIPTLAAEKVTIKVGPIEQSVPVSDLEQFAKTGEISKTLKPYSPILTPQLRQMLNKKLEIKPDQGNKIVDNLLNSPAGSRLLKSLMIVMPDSNIEQIKFAINLAWRQANGLSPIAFLKAYPKENVTIDVSSAITLASKINLPYWQTQALSSLLEQDLFVETPGFKPSFNPANPGKFAVQQETIILEDKNRNRTIPVDIYWGNISTNQPTDNNITENPNQPLVIISHGFGSNRRFLAYLARHLASYGITVAALDHPGSNVTSLAAASISSNPADLLSPQEFIDRPKDISFLLNELEKINRSPGILSNKFNTEQVTIIGHSLGGYTALAVAGAQLELDKLKEVCQHNLPIGQALGDWIQCAAAQLSEKQINLRDRRIVSAIALNPLVGNIFGSNSLSTINIPTLILMGTEDLITPGINHQLRPFMQLKDSKYLLTAIGGTHLSIGEPPSKKFDNNQKNMDTFNNTLINERRGQDIEPLRQLLRGVSLAFIKQLTPEAKKYEPFLTPVYAQSISTPDLPLRLNSQLPKKLTNWLHIATVSDNQNLNWLLANTFNLLIAQIIVSRLKIKMPKYAIEPKHHI